ncbi:MAG: AAA family ATPase, partial [Eubacteriales bacterium]
RKHELLARKLNNRLEVDGYIYTPLEDMEYFGNPTEIKNLVQMFNNKVYYKHLERHILVRNRHLYIRGAEDDAVQIMDKLKNCSLTGAGNYTSNWSKWSSNNPTSAIGEEKKELLRNLYSDSQVAIIYGAAGTGKSTLIGYFSRFANVKRRIYLANTNTAVNNLKTRVGTAGDCDFFTVAKFISSNSIDRECFLLVVDECSTISNKDMNKVLQVASFSYLMLVGDVYQIQSIHFGNWFEIARNFLPPTAHHELTTSYRASNADLQNFWDSVRNLENDILEKMVNFQISAPLDTFSFQKEEEDEVLLCMQYDGLYGINNTNHILQENNPNRAYYFGVQRYKEGDPVIFRESERYFPVLYNNLKGVIEYIEQDQGYIQFDIKIAQLYDEADFMYQDTLELISSDRNTSIIRIKVFEAAEGIDEEAEKNRVPFQVCYAMSVHKAQGLEFDSVKIILTNEERITSNIFYTAVTRAKSKLKIYWSKETEKKVIDQLEGRPTLGKDINFLRQAMQEKGLFPS